MKKLMASLCVAGLVAWSGCNTSPTGGRSGTTGPTTGPATVTKTGPSGTTTTTERTSAYPTPGGKETFKLHGPELATHVEQGTAKTFKVSISRDSNFKDDVTLKAASPDPKLHVTIEPNILKGSEKKDAEVTVTADGDAKLGKETVHVTGTPQSGNPTTVDVTVDVTAKAKNK
jgi:hypothetical protein